MTIATDFKGLGWSVSKLSRLTVVLSSFKTTRMHKKYLLKTLEHCKNLTSLEIELERVQLGQAYIKALFKSVISMSNLRSLNISLHSINVKVSWLQHFLSKLSRLNLFIQLNL